MEEVVIDGFSPENSVYMTAMQPEFCRAISLDSDSKGQSSESVVFEDHKVFGGSSSPKSQDFQLYDFPEQPPPEMIPETTTIINDYLTSTAQGKHFEDILLEETIKDPIRPLIIKQEEKEKEKGGKEKEEEEEEERKIEVPVFGDNLLIIESDPKGVPEDKVKDSVIIKSTKLVKSGLFGIGNYYVYEIVSLLKNEKFVVFRRFKDFEWLYETLKGCYRGLSIPPLPNKTLKLMQDASEAEIRKIQLEKILNMILKHSTLKKSQQIFLFLTTPNTDFSKVKESIRKPKGKFKYNDLEDAIDQIISKIQAKMNQIFHFRIVPFNKDLLAIQKYINTLEIPSLSLAHHFNAYLSNQEKTSSLLQGIHFLHNPNFSKNLQILKNSTIENFRELKVIKNQLSTENLKIEALQGALNDYKNILKKYLELEALVERKITKSYKSFEDSEKYLAEIENIKKEIKALEEETNTIEKNVKKEKIWFQADRDEKFENVIVGIVDANLKKACKEEEFWLNFKHECWMGVKP